MEQLSIKNYYAILGVSRKATKKQIKKSHRKLVMKYRADNGQDYTKFTEISEAWSVLRDKEKRSSYNKEYDLVYGNGKRKEPKQETYQRQYSSSMNNAFTDLTPNPEDYSSTITINCSISQLLSTKSIPNTNGLRFPGAYVRRLIQNKTEILFRVTTFSFSINRCRFDFIPDLEGMSVTVTKQKPSKVEWSNNVYTLQTPLANTKVNIRPFFVDEVNGLMHFKLAGVPIIQPITNKKMRSILIVDTND